MISSIISSLCASLSNLMSIINLFSVLDACMIMMFNIVALSVKIVIFRVFSGICFGSFCIIVVVLQASANANFLPHVQT